MVASLVDKMKNSPAGVLVDYKGITVEDDTKLRHELREAGVEYAVIKNTMLRFACDELGFNALDEVLNGNTALAISTTDDVISPAKILGAYAKKNDKFVIKGGFLEGEVIPVSEVQKLADMPSKEVLIAQVLYGFNYPLTQLAIALDEIVKKSADGEALVGSLVAPKAAAEEAAE
jgi:large subunit ribosomal protein L10